MHCSSRVFPLLRPIQLNLIILVVCASRCICAPALNSAEIKSLIDPIEGTNQDDLLEAVDPVYVRSLFFFPNKCKPGTQLTPDGKCVVPVVRESTASNSQTALQLAIQYAKRYQPQPQPQGVRRPKPHRKPPKPELGTETVPTDPTTTATTPAFFSETDPTTLSSTSFNSSETEITTRTRVKQPSSLLYIVEVAVATQSTLGDPPEDVSSTSTSLPVQQFGPYGESTPGPLLDPETTLTSVMRPDEGTTEISPTWLQGTEVLIPEFTEENQQNHSAVSQISIVDPAISDIETTIITVEMSTEAPTKPSPSLSNSSFTEINDDISSTIRQSIDTPEADLDKATGTLQIPKEVAAEPAKLENSSVDHVMEPTAYEQTLNTTPSPAVSIELEASNPTGQSNQENDENATGGVQRDDSSPDSSKLADTVPEEIPVTELPWLQQFTTVPAPDLRPQASKPTELVSWNETLRESSEATKAHPEIGALHHYNNVTPATDPLSPVTFPIYKATMPPILVSTPGEFDTSFQPEPTVSSPSSTLAPISSNKIAQVSQFVENDERPSKIRFTDQVAITSTPSYIFPTEEAALSNGFRERLVQSFQQHPINLAAIPAIGTSNNERSTSIIFPQDSAEASKPLHTSEGRLNFHSEGTQAIQQHPVHPAKIFDTRNPTHRSSQSPSASRQEALPFESFELASTSRELDASSNSNRASPFSLLPYLFNYPHYAFPYFSSTRGDGESKEHRGRSNFPHST